MVESVAPSRIVFVSRKFNAREPTVVRRYPLALKLGELEWVLFATCRRVMSATRRQRCRDEFLPEEFRSHAQLL
jgi:hypothetical protein